MTTRIIIGDALASLKTMASGSVHCIVTSPPYHLLRSYLPPGHPDKHLEMGSEPTLAGYVLALVGLMREARRVLRDDGTAWVNIGDGYARDVAKGQHKPGDSGKSDYIITEGGGKSAGGMKFRLPTGHMHYLVHMNHCNQGENEGTCCYGEGDICPALTDIGSGLKPKDLMMVPARVAIALQDDGWYLRKDIIWHKPNPMPESCTDRPTSSHEHIFLLAKSERYFFDAEAVRERMESGPSDLRKMQEGLPRIGGKHKDLDDGLSKASAATNIGKKRSVGDPSAGRNLRDVWTMATVSFPGSHFATFPPELPERCIKAGTSEKGCCASCGSPWARVVEKGEPDLDAQRAAGGDAEGGYDGQSTKGHDAAGVQNASDVKRRILEGMRHRKTVDWQPSCGCPPADPIPCTVLDPFAGAATTLMVAERLGRDSIGLELNPEYAAMAETRLLADRGALPIEGVGLFAALAAAD